MAEPFKNMFNKEFFDRFTKALKLVMKDFDGRKFVSQVMDDKWKNMEFDKYDFKLVKK